MSEAIRAIVVEDHPVMRDSIIRLVEENQKVKVIAKGESGNQVLELLEKHKPDILITDLQMPLSVDGPSDILWEPIIGLQKAIKAYPLIPIIVITQENSLQTIQSLAEVGVMGYLLKSDDFSKVLATAVEMIHLGSIYYSPDVWEVINSAPKLKPKPLTEQETAVLRAIVQFPGLSRALMADRLYISVNTLHRHINHIFEKLRVSKMEECVLKALRMGIVTMDDVMRAS